MGNNIDQILKSIEKDFGKGIICKLGDSPIENIPSISTGSLSLNDAVGIGGIPQGRIIEIYGPESSGKTTLTLSIIAQAQKQGMLCAFIDAEHALDTQYAHNIGVDVDNLIVSQPDYGEQALTITERLVLSQEIGLIVVDSVAALTPKAEIDGEMGDAHMGLQARLMSQALRKLTSITKKNNVTVIFINQIRQKIGVMFGSNETTTGGNALKFYSSVRLDIRRIKALKDKDENIGNRVKVKVIKNKVAPPFKEIEFDILFGQGIDYVSELIDLGVKYDIIDKSGAWFSYEDQKLGQGKENSKKVLLSDQKLLDEIFNKIEIEMNKNKNNHRENKEENIEIED